MPIRYSVLLAYAPSPVQVVVTDREVDGRRAHDIIRRFPNPQGRACKLCDDCTFIPGKDGQGLCLKSVAGPIDLDRVAVLGLVGGRVVYGGGGALRG